MGQKDREVESLLDRIAEIEADRDRIRAAVKAHHDQRGDDPRGGETTGEMTMVTRSGKGRLVMLNRTLDPPAVGVVVPLTLQQTEELYRQWLGAGSPLIRDIMVHWEHTDDGIVLTLAVEPRGGVSA